MAVGSGWRLVGAGGWWLGGKKIALRGGGGGGGDTEAHFPNPPPPPLLGCRDGRGGSGRGCPTCRAGGGGFNPTSMAQNDTHVALIILTTQMWGAEIIGGKTFSGQNLCSCAFGANIRSYTKQRARHGTPFLAPPPPPPPSAGVHVTPPPPSLHSNFQVALAALGGWRLMVPWGGP